MTVTIVSANYKSFTLPIQLLEVDLKLNRGFLFFSLWELMG